MQQKTKAGGTERVDELEVWVTVSGPQRCQSVCGNRECCFVKTKDGNFVLAGENELKGGEASTKFLKTILIIYFGCLGIIGR